MILWKHRLLIYIKIKFFHNQDNSLALVIATGAQTYDAATAASYANPYQNQVISGALGDLQEAYSQSQKGMSAQAIGAGAFGGSRQAIENVLGQERYLDTVGDTSARLRQAGFESGANRFMQDRSAQLQSVSCSKLK
jgi:hypothetical protein